MTPPITLRRRSPAELLRWLAGQLDDGQDPAVVGIALSLLADEMLYNAGRLAPPPDRV